MIMDIDWTHFTPWLSLVGGLLLGIATSAFILLNGRILGISGILGGLLPPNKGDVSWRISFILGLFAAPWVFNAFVPLSALESPRIDSGFFAIAVAGLMVGFGTRYGSGCTSGHGVCGLSRLSLRSLFATLVFMLAGFVMVYVLKHAV
jgi:uncharacterized membrane protein YedE/YeeE